MEENKKQNYVIDCSGEALYDLISKAVKDSADAEKIELAEDKAQNTRSFNRLYNRKFTRLKKKMERMLLDLGAGTTDFSETDNVWEIDRARIEQTIDRIKFEVLTPTYELLGPEVKEASRSVQGMVDLMYSKRMESDEIHEIVAGLARWHVLDDFQRQLQPHDFSACFADFGRGTHAGHPMENLYELADKERLRDTLEALHREKFSMTVSSGWMLSQARTKQFLLAFMLSLYHHPLAKLYGKMAAFHRFFTDVCGYTFVKAAKTLQNWFRNYCDFDRERTSRTGSMPKNEPQKARSSWLRKLRDYTRVEELAEWMRTRFPQYGVCMA